MKNMKMSDFEWSVIKEVNVALAEAGNYYSDGVVNWSFVDADVYGVVKPALNELTEYREAFNRYADIIESGIEWGRVKALTK
jgi:hypothetical protein